MHFVLVTYDIQNDRRRTRIHKILTGFGRAVQYSVFECFLSDDDVLLLRRKLQQHMDPKHAEDSIRYYFLCRSCVEKIIVDGHQDLEIDAPFTII
ncbi:CRISPR-associated endonuclease Cas2 [Prosthecochloris sp. N3]|uniref:CRISPR-associated endoribonuclease Cas2 n=1 Tax=Prosthecochloris ethylica TaxID=2743976 RepID=A0ABR9XQK2_9CHLB|nr:CRISPR-associated endonuclease Cas2 [Prosthecochloris ethylica]MBF0585473.1 CRISPR-associated endonuclease Cas2 [Prosthecochloris ethylica]MBF0636259.1 CRISPR-associated endonuclease Cas2 [Prosthecochloris ethylica]NUK46703.1 CRISPR-associated endonuclease Cas2 [Prosthecochloris ethylica]